MVKARNMKISELEKRSGLSRDTIRYYEKAGVLAAPKKSDNGYKMYTQAHLDALGFIERGKAIGFTLQTIKNGYLRYQALGHFCPQFRRELNDKKAFFEQRIQADKAALAKIEQLLAQ